jgi:hypothetical protein
MKKYLEILPNNWPKEKWIEFWQPYLISEVNKRCMIMSCSRCILMGFKEVKVKTLKCV